MQKYSFLKRALLASLLCSFSLFSNGVSADNVSKDINIIHQRVLNEAIHYPQAKIEVASTIKMIKKSGEIKGHKCDAATFRSFILPLVQQWYHTPNSLTTKQKQRISAAVGYWCDHHIISSNWTKRAFEEPRMASVVGLLLEAIDAKAEKDNIQKLATITEGSFGSRVNTDTFQGANIGYRLDGMFGFVALKKSVEALEVMSDNITFTTNPHNQGIGLQSDYSWWQHNGGTGQNYWIGYGTSWLGDILDYGQRTKGTQWELSTYSLNQIQDAILNALSFHYYRNFSDFHVLGRHTTKKGSSNQPRHLVQMIHKLQEIGGDRLSRAAELTEIADNLTNVNYPFASKYFYNSDLMIYREQRYFTSLKMRSNRTTGPESGNGNGQMNYHFGDGTFFIVRDGKEYNDVKIGLDFQNLPGTTAESNKGASLPLVDWGRNNTSENQYAGGLTNGYQAIAAFQQHRTNDYSNVLANKAYFYEKDQILFAGNAIRKKQSSENEIITNINQARWSSDILAYINGEKMTFKKGEEIKRTFKIKTVSWFLQDSVGYLITPNKGEEVEVRLEAMKRSGDWNTLDKVYKKGDTQSVDVFSLSIVNTKNDHYNYTIFPSIVPLDMMAQVTETSLQLVANNETVQAVYSSHRNQAQVVFYKAGSVTLPTGLTLEANKPVIFTCREEENGIRIVAADPLQSQSQVFITVNREMKPTLFALPTNEATKFKLEIPLNMGDWAGKSAKRFYPFAKQTKEKQWKKIHAASFEDGKQWVVEQYKGGDVTFSNGEMEIVDERGCTIWYKKELEGNIAIEYDATVISNGGKHDRVSDLNCFWMAQDPRQTTDFFHTTPKRVGKFYDYNEMKLYYVGYGGHYNSRSRFRKYSANFDRPMPLEYDYRTKEYHIVPNQNITIRIEVCGHWVRYKRNGELVYEMYDPSPLTKGYFGFRTVNNHMKVTRFEVFSLM